MAREAVQTSTTQVSALDYQLLPLELVDESPLNPRRTFDAARLDELAQSIRAKGVVVPVLARPRGERFELVYGHRRFRAAQKAGLSVIPATVRELDDAQVVEVALLENLARHDLSPLEEGEAYRRLMDLHQYSAEQIAERVGKSRETIYGRMKLAQLQGRARELVVKGELAATVGLLIARLPTPEMQEEALGELEHDADAYGRELSEVSFRDAQVALAQSFQLRLKEAPFDTKDAFLEHVAGACTACPKRTGAQPELFADVKGDTCLDRACWKVKVKAHAARAKEKAEKKGLEVLPAKTLKSREYVDLEQVRWIDGKSQKVKAAVGKALPEEVAVAIDEEGRAHQVVKAEDLRAALRKAGKKDLAQQITPSPAKPYDYEAEREKEQRKRDIERQILEHALPELLQRARETKEAEFLRCLARVLMTDWRAAQAGERAGINQKNVVAELAKRDAGELRELVTMLAAGPLSGLHGSAEAAFNVFGVDLKKHEAAVKAAAKGQEKPAPAKAKKGRAA